MIRQATPDDHERLLDLWEALMANGAAADPRFSATPEARQHMSGWVRETWYRSEPFPHVLVWEQDGEIGAFVGGHPRHALPVVDLAPTARIGDLFVAPELRGQRVGTALVTAWIANARQAGFPRIEVGTLVADERAVGFWKSIGFSPWQVHFALD